MRNGTIEFFRFIFAICIMLCHMYPFYAMYWGGAIGVEFFFIVSGFLLCKKIYDCKKTSALTPWKIIWKKISAIYVEYLVAIWSAFIITRIFFPSFDDMSFNQAIAMYLCNSFFMGGILGFPTDAILNLNWWLITMFMALTVIIYLIKTSKEAYLYIFCPFFCLIIYGYLSHTYGVILVVMDKAFGGDFIFIGWLRGLADLCMGGISFVIYQYIVSNNIERRLLTIIELLGYGFTIFAVLSRLLDTMPYISFLIVIFLSISVGVSFSAKSMLYGIMQKNVCALGGGN